MKPPSPTDEQDVSHISGNVPPHIKRALSNPKAFYETRFERKIEGPVFFEGIQERLKVKEISVRQKSADAANYQGRVVVELDVEEGVFIRNLQVFWRRDKYIELYIRHGEYDWATPWCLFSHPIYYVSCIPGENSKFLNSTRSFRKMLNARSTCTCHV